MEDNKEVNNEEVKEQVEEVAKPEVKDDRPAKNYEAELERKNREIERLRLEAAQKAVQPKQKDPNDLRTWPDHELKALRNNQQYAQYHGEVDDILLDRRMEAKLAAREETNKRVSAEMQLRQQFPDALDPTSEFAVKMDKIIEENDLSKTPAGRLVAAKLAAAELNQGKKTSDALGRKKEQDRVANVKSQLVDGDRPKPTETPDVTLEAKRQKLAEKLKNASQPGPKKDEDSTEAISDILNDRFGGRKGFFGSK